MSIPKVEFQDVSLELGEHGEVGEEYKESWETGLGDILAEWRSREEGIGEERLLPTGGGGRERRVSQEFVNLCLNFENVDGEGGETSGAGRVETKLSGKHYSFSSILNSLSTNNTTFRAKQKIKTLKT